MQRSCEEPTAGRSWAHTPSNDARSFIDALEILVQYDMSSVRNREREGETFFAKVVIKIHVDAEAGDFWEDVRY